jgi:hypothetical protein
MTPWIGAAVGIVGAVLLAVFGYLLMLARDVSRLQQVCENVACIPPLKLKVERLETSMELYFKMLDPYLNKALRDWPTHMERDILMDKLEHARLTLADVDRLDALLRAAMREDPDPMRVLGIGFARARLTWLKSRLESERHD